MAQYGATIWYRKVGVDDGSTLATRMAQGFFAERHDRTGAVLVSPLAA